MSSLFSTEKDITINSEIKARFLLLKRMWWGENCNNRNSYSDTWYKYLYADFQKITIINLAFMLFFENRNNKCATIIFKFTLF